MATVAVYDYIVVGAGTCGSLLANRLSSNPELSVALIDPGVDTRGNEAVEDPAQWIEVGQTSLNWDYQSEPQPQLGNRRLSMPAGKGIGGTSLINGMTYVRGDKAQFDAWESIGNPGWNWDSMLQYYIELEHLFAPNQWQLDAGASYDEHYHGFDGELSVGFNPDLHNGTFYNLARETWASLGHDHNDDVNRGVTDGFSIWPQTLDPVKNTRADAATAFLWPIADRNNLFFVNGTASRVAWGNESCLPVAQGVDFIAADGSLQTALARKEVILAAGALRTPLILEKSGVGHAARLQNLDIDVVVDLPGVGENMIEQPNNVIVYNNAAGPIPGYTPYGTFITAKELFGADEEKIALQTKESIPAYAEQIVKGSNGALEIAAVQKLLEIQYNIMFEQNTTIAEVFTAASGTSLASAFWALMPLSRGSVHLKTKEAINDPQIDPHYLDNPLDVHTQVEIGRLCSKFWAGTGIDFTTIAGAQANATNEEWTTFIKDTVAANSHSLGSTAMMSRDLGGVVDDQLRVYGTRGLRVVDAGVLPLQFSGHLTATLYAVAQRAAEMILKGSL
ncbi:GMC oxidoreductase-domain-containing protein [Emericellopsis atlantica]|uniref:GMC oxidoreductase-domain-containing protein n=1 Tax=Emericellopsis atlantica TaxID=2614577 RepID=A0A9P7ZJ77_9HYPO|nr:GMC oxidoreductase-domain-containing protein [Emericellopsis atlantica]KAG9253015.1 GMC oxidoreductase-domain-containing protein [Emericellopsis atlantica]